MQSEYLAFIAVLHWRNITASFTSYHNENTEKVKSGELGGHGILPQFARTSAVSVRPAHCQAANTH
jgi:hypothetical protein